MLNAISFTPVDLIVNISLMPSPFGVNTFGISKVKPSSTTITAVAVAEQLPAVATNVTVNEPVLVYIVLGLVLVDTAPFPKLQL